MQYMSAITFILTFCLAANVQATNTTAADKLIAFKKLEKKHKDDWFNHMKQVHNQKYDLLKKIHGDWVNFGTHAIKEGYQANDCSVQAKEALYTDHLRQSIDLHVDHNNVWQHMCQENHTKEREIAARHEQELIPHIQAAGMIIKE